MSSRWTRRSAAATVTLVIAAAVTVATVYTDVAVAAPADPGTYQALTPARILDTRVGDGAPTAPVAPAGTLAITVLGQGGVPASGVSAVAFNLTDTGPSTYGFISAYPAGQSLPLASSLNFSAGETRAHLVVVAPGTDGQVALYNGSAGAVDLVADVVGYYTAGTPTDGGEFAPLTPARILDTRTGNGAPRTPLDNYTQAVVSVLGRGGVPASGVSSVMLNLTATRPSTYGFLTAAPYEYRSSSSVNFHGGISVSNLVVVPVTEAGTFTVTASLQGHVDAVADVLGYYVGGPPSAAGRFGALAPDRLLDTRKTHTPIPAQGSIDVPVAGHSRVPAAGVSAVVLNVTVAAATSSGFLAAYPTGIARPTSSTINFDHNTVANQVIAPLGPDGTVRVYNGSSAPVQLVLDVSGYIGPVPGPLTWSPHVPIPGPFLQQVSCGSATFCMAYQQPGYLTPGHFYRYNGRTWSLTASPVPSMSAVSCVASGFCLAPGYGESYAFDGTAWTPTPSLPANGNPLSVSCVTSTFCVAAGTNDLTTTAWLYDGTDWTTIDPGAGSNQNAVEVSCVTTTFCLLVGENGFTARFNGTHWTQLGRWTGSSVINLSCVTTTFCMALSPNAGTAEVHDGNRWGPPTALDVPQNLGDFAGQLACASTTLCLAYTNYGYQLVYDGTSWSTEFELDPGNNNGVSIACAAPAFCVILEGTAFLTGT